jgi:hypothetical protein
MSDVQQTKQTSKITFKQWKTSLGKPDARAWVEEQAETYGHH